MRAQWHGLGTASACSRLACGGATGTVSSRLRFLTGERVRNASRCCCRREANNATLEPQFPASHSLCAFPTLHFGFASMYLPILLLFFKSGTVFKRQAWPSTSSCSLRCARVNRHQMSSQTGRRSTCTTGASTTVQPSPNQSHVAWNCDVSRRLSRFIPRQKIDMFPRILVHSPRAKTKCNLILETCNRGTMTRHSEHVATLREADRCSRCDSCQRLAVFFTALTGILREVLAGSSVASENSDLFAAMSFFNVPISSVTCVTLAFSLEMRFQC